MTGKHRRTRLVQRDDACTDRSTEGLFLTSRKCDKGNRKKLISPLDHTNKPKYLTVLPGRLGMKVPSGSGSRPQGLNHAADRFSHSQDLLKDIHTEMRQLRIFTTFTLGNKRRVLPKTFTFFPLWCPQHCDSRRTRDRTCGFLMPIYLLAIFL